MHTPSVKLIKLTVSEIRVPHTDMFVELVLAHCNFPVLQCFYGLLLQFHTRNTKAVSTENDLLEVKTPSACD